MPLFAMFLPDNPALALERKYVSRDNEAVWPARYLMAPVSHIFIPNAPVIAIIAAALKGCDDRLARSRGNTKKKHSRAHFFLRNGENFISSYERVEIIRFSHWPQRQRGPLFLVRQLCVRV